MRSSATETQRGQPVSGTGAREGYAHKYGARGLFAEAVARPVLTPGEDAGVEADESEPIGLALRPAAAAKGRGEIPEGATDGGGGRDGHGAGRAVGGGLAPIYWNSQRDRRNGSPPSPQPHPESSPRTLRLVVHGVRSSTSFIPFRRV